jgi:heme-degrading monooxygenase HmoA
MPLILIAEAENREIYEAVASQANMTADRPAGLVLHSAGETDSGAVRIVDVWESAEHAAAFERDRLFPAMREAGHAGPDGPQPERYEPFDYIA